MGNSACCVVNCKNNRKNSQYKFYRFPTAMHWLPQREKWIAAIKRNNLVGSTWTPKKHDVICSAHFIGNKKSQHPLSPSFVPTIFPSKYRNTQSVNKKNNINRHGGYIKQNNQQDLSVSTTSSNIIKMESQDDDEHVKINTDNNLISFEYIKVEPLFSDESTNSIQKQLKRENETNNDNFGILVDKSPKYADKECQVHIFIDGFKPEKNFICNRYMCNNFSNDVQIQTDITETSRIIVIPSQKKFKTNMCQTIQKTYVDRLVGPNRRDSVCEQQHFTGFSSIKKDEQMLDLAGVNFHNFNFLLQKVTKNPENCKISKENRLLIYLVKKKTGLSFSALSVLFCVHRTTISRIFKFTSEEMFSESSNFDLWPKELKHLVKSPSDSEVQDNDAKKRKIEK